MKNIFKKILGQYLVKLINLYKVKDGDLIYFENFNYWQKSGFHIIPNHYYHPIPDTSHLDDKVFAEKKMVGVALNDKTQLDILGKLKRYKNEYKAFKKFSKKVNPQIDPKFYFGNIAFDGVDALVYYGMIRYLKPRKIIEIGSGWSTKIAAQACTKNDKTELVSIEPYPQQILEKGFSGLTTLIKKKIENVPLDFFRTLRDGDILFIDSSHNVRIGGDVNYLFLEVMPRLNKGVYVHIHDIFFPYDYPKDWVLKERRFWTEQYLLHAFLLFNSAFKVIYANSYMGSKHLDKIKEVFPKSPSFGGGSIWIKKIK